MGLPHTSVLTDTNAARNAHTDKENAVPTISSCEDGTVQEPVNREPPMQELISSWLTTQNAYDRNHGPIQHIAFSEHTLTVDGLVRNPLVLSMSDLQQMRQRTVTCSLLCAGNRRHSMRERVKEVNGVDWFDGAVMNCVWRGPLLRDVLLKAGVENERDVDANGEIGGSKGELHVQFACRATEVQDDSWYGSSVPLSRVMNPEMDVILALEMNGVALSPRHGFPLRSIVPGYIGARSVKWLDRVSISTEESPNHYQKKDYKVLPPTATDAETAEHYWDAVPAMGDMPINSCVAVPSTDSTVKLDSDGMIEVRGYAVPHGSDGPVVKVEVSGDEGQTWVEAELDRGPEENRSKWTWVLWRARVKLEKGQGRKIWSRAEDKGGNKQELERSGWNLRGVGYNGFESVWDLKTV